MTRFMQELNGRLGEYWQKRAEKELETVRADLDAGRITIDEKGIARNCIGRVLMEDMLEKLALVTEKVDTIATAAAREAEVAKELESYRANRKPHSAEEIAEMRAAFGKGTTVVNILTGEKAVL
ncbi:MAG: hypothetical protein K2K21_05910 [Lachnospiraceae bacterium]|nr:hypothetical protein [Lachnospiraceae bacterium]